MAFAASQGLDLRKVYEVITASAGNSWMFENRMPHVLDGDYAPRSAVEIFVKDLGIIQDMARNAKFPVPVASAALQMFLMTAPPAWAAMTTPRWRGCMPRLPVRRCPASRNSKQKSKRTFDAPFCRQSLHDVHRGPVPRSLRRGGEGGVLRRRIPVSLRYPAKEVGERLHRNGLTQALFNLPPGNWEAGEKGFASLPERFDDLKKVLPLRCPMPRRPVSSGCI